MNTNTNKSINGHQNQTASLIKSDDFKELASIIRTDEFKDLIELLKNPVIASMVMQNNNSTMINTGLENGFPNISGTLQETLEETLPEIEPLFGLSVEETIKIYAQVAIEFEQTTRISEVLKFNSGL